MGEAIAVTPPEIPRVALPISIVFNAYLKCLFLETQISLESKDGYMLSVFSFNIKVLIYYLN